MKKILKFSGYILGIFFFAYSFSQVQWSDFISSIKNVATPWIAIMAASFLLSMFLRSVRWHIITGLPWINMSKVWEATAIGYLGTAIYPAKAGDILKSIRLQQLTGISNTEALMSTLIDRLFDGLALCGILAILVIAWGKQLNLNFVVWIIAACFILGLFVIALYSVSGHRLERFFTSLATQSKVGTRLNQIYQQSLTAVHLLKSPKLLCSCLTIQILITLFDILACWFLFYAFGWKELSLLPAIIMLAYLAAAFSLPSTPGYIGVYQIASIFALRGFGISESEAVAYGTIFQTITFVLFVSVGIQTKLRRPKKYMQLADET
ncbi:MULTISPECIES: lysylphosphatidylglycerol synthase transmembrane domain-containing protein [Legionella]|uniref:Uncharacterized protein n=1 Tax=Legionella steelei TaxID=947033 RepID=A0A0W0ZLJ8_9GAMM|nr:MULTISPECIES: lysylphosphatidylglycerol synthase transmembrane domain-containing protein [Legionella]KTD69651.1 hypothetical protein Lste_2809 [Legionella steelei]MBN9227201.1 flippase-like domain-containing protein [Legionella steelei]